MEKTDLKMLELYLSRIHQQLKYHNELYERSLWIQFAWRRNLLLQIDMLSIEKQCIEFCINLIKLPQ